MKKSSLHLGLVILTAFSFILHSHGQRSKENKIKNISKEITKAEVSTGKDAIPSIALAASIGESLLKEKYNKEAIDESKPLAISLTDNIWKVSAYDNNEKEICFVEISKVSGRVLTSSR